MELKEFYWLVLMVMAAYPVVCLGETSFHNEEDDFDLEPDTDYKIGLHSNDMPKKFLFSTLPRSAGIRFNDEEILNTTTECVTSIANDEHIPPDEEISTTASSSEQQVSSAPQPATTRTETQSYTMKSEDQEIKAKELRNLVQHLYIAQARVQLEATEIKKAQAVANTAQQALEEAANHVRAITSYLQSSQQEVASAAIRAQTAQLQLAAHDQLLFAARQDVDALSSQMVGLQAEEGISQPKITVDLSDLLEKLKQPLTDAEKPTPVPPLIELPTQSKFKHISSERHYQQHHTGSGFRDPYFE